MNQNPQINIVEKLQGAQLSQVEVEKQKRVEKWLGNAMESCITKAGFSAVAGGAFGLFWGVFTAALDSSHFASSPFEGPVQAATEAVKPKVPLRQRFVMPSIYGITNSLDTLRKQVKFMETLKMTWSRSWFMAKAFGGVGLLYSGIECTIEKVRLTVVNLN